ncbi:hypothetical protein L873DRAFT_1787065 [Choiromyces venosus 120613-1]|uniref:Uncharacterized protein n=1 Tax=Choiromyces venosus 120613-1 TaxID=1336337 RepID=A0A3N4JY18_9PEZI|nr:hypothetical protein L873DRAFT_1787065 [Choiromyces venosus 120613-1]
MQVAEGEAAGTWTSCQILCNEISWIKGQVIESSKMRRDEKIASMLEDESIILAVWKYISEVKEVVTSSGIAQGVFVSSHWAETNNAVIPPIRDRIDGEKLLDQIRNKAISAFEAEFPGCQALFLFDNAKNHCKYVENALRVSKMNMADSGKHARPIHTTYVLDKSHPDGGYYQSIVQNDGTPKGLKSVLTEWGLWLIGGGQFLTQCGTKTMAENLTPNPKCLKGSTCCAPVLHALQPDFKAPKGEIKEVIEVAGYLVLFYLPFHCEINFIEYFWGAAKQYTCANYGYDFPLLQRLVPEALAQIPNTLIWKYYSHTQRIIDAYMSGELN